MEITDYNPIEDKLLLLGDYVDRGYKSKEVLQQIVTMASNKNVIVVRGNHDQMFLDAMYKNEDGLFLHNGGFETIKSYCGTDWFEGHEDNLWNRYLEAKSIIMNQFACDLEFLNNLKYYHEDDDHIYVHAGLNPFYEDWRKQPNEDYIWIRDIFLNNKTNTDKTVVFGHTPTINIQNNPDPWFGGDKIGVDGGCCFGYQLNCLEISEDGYKMYLVKRGSQ